MLSILWRPLQNILLKWRRQYWSWRVAKYRSMFGTFSLGARRGLPHGVSRYLNFCSLIRRTSPCSRLVRQARDSIYQFKLIFLQCKIQHDSYEFMVWYHFLVWFQKNRLRQSIFTRQGMVISNLFTRATVALYLDVWRWRQSCQTTWV